MSADQLLLIRMKMQGQRVVQTELAATAAATRGVGDAAEVAGKKTRLARAETFLWRQGLYTLRRQLFYVTAGIIGASTYQKRFTLSGMMSSLRMNFTPSAIGCNRPNGPTRVGPQRFWMRPISLRSSHTM